MLQISDSLVRNRSNGTSDDFPKDRELLVQQASAVVAGRISDHAGGFMQITYDGVERHTSLDLVDLRYVWNPTTRTHHLLFGVTANNNPSVRDPWNILAVWGFPYAASSVAPAPSAATLLDGVASLASRAL